MVSIDARGLPNPAVGGMDSSEGARGVAGWGCSIGRKHPSQVMDGESLWEFAPRQGLGSGVGEWVPMLVRGGQACRSTVGRR